MNKFLKISVWTLTIIAIAALWYFTHRDYVGHPLKGVELTLDRADENGFIDKDAVYQDIMNICDTVNNKDITKIPVDSVRSYLKLIPWAVYTDANITFNEILVVNIVECQPVMRVYNKNGQSVFLDYDGNVYPAKPGYTAHLLIGSGMLNFRVLNDKSASVYGAEYKNNDLPKIYQVMKSVLNNSYSKCCVKQVYYDGKDYEMVMNNVDMKVILGDDSNVDEKLMNMQYFFEKMQGSPELKGYSAINFNFENQVVCTRNKTKK